MSARAGTKQENASQWVGVQPTDPESDPIPVKLQDANGAAQGVAGNPVYVTATGTTVYIGGPNPLPTEDTGTNTNPRLYEVNHAFRSQVLTLTDGLAHALYTRQTTPGRVAGAGVYIYKIRIHNRGGGLASVQLEQPVGTLIGLPVSCEHLDTINEAFPTPLPVGITGVFARAGITVANVDIQIIGLEV